MTAPTPAAPPHPRPAQAAGLGELGRTTSPRAWLALVALFLVIVAFGVWGLFGTIPVQSTISATATDGTSPLQIPAGVAGVVEKIISPTEVRGLAAETDGTLPAGTVLATIAPNGGGKPVEVKVPVTMNASLDVIQGSAVTADTIVAHGAPASSPGSDKGRAQVYAFLGADEVQVVTTAQSLSVTPAAPNLKGAPAPIQIDFVGSVPVSQEQIALLTGGNTIYAQQAYDAAQGAPYTVIFTYSNATDADAVTGSMPAVITVTQATPHPFQLLFGS
ncbi:MAG: hypothetical protein U0R64_00970 [Candidatus Nanopelagicales bacterium]